MTVTINGVASTQLTGLSYEPFGPVTGWTYGNGLTRTKSYDLDRRLTSLTTKNGATSLQSLSYGYNTNDLITQISNGVNPSLNQGTGYDELSRVSSITAGGQTGAMAYDATGNRTGYGGITYTIASGSNWMASTNAYGPVTFLHDPAGNLAAYDVSGYGNVTYTYDPFNRMQTVNFPGPIGTYGYNAYNRKKGTEELSV